jgi:hypothetical protein
VPIFVRRSLRVAAPLATPALSAVVALGFAVPAPAAQSGARDVPTFAIPRLDQPVAVDGVLDEVFWEQALRLELTYETEPGENVEPPVRTECWLAHSTSHLYYACRAHDPRPAEIRARLTDRDQATEDDTVGLAIDTFGSYGRAYVLDVNPLGVQNDRLYTEADGRSDPAWDAIWSSAGRITAEGYTVEAAIPFSSIRFPRSNGSQTWGFNLRRYYPRDSRHRFALTPQPREDGCRLCQSAHLVGFAGIDPGRNLEVTPTITGISRSRRESLPDGPFETEDPDIEPGLSVRWSMTPNLTLNGTVNPDFSQVEADEAQLDVNRRFALFFEERRPFFLEGIDLFRTPIQAVYTRTIADPSWGAKVSGKEGPHALGAFVARDEITNLLLPGVEGSSLEVLEREADAAVLRYRRDLGRTSTIGVLYTDRGAGDYGNQVVGVDAHLRLDRANTLSLQALGSRTRYPDGLAGGTAASRALEDGALLVEYRHQRRSWSADLRFSDLGEEFRADLGFVPRVGYRSLEGEGEYHWFGGDDRWFTRFEVGAEWERQESWDGRLLSRETELGAVYQGPMQSIVELQLGEGEEVFGGESFSSDRLGFFVFAQPTAELGLGIGGGVADSIDFAGARPGSTLELGPFLTYRFGRHLHVGLSHSYGDLALDRDTVPPGVSSRTLFVANQTQVRAVYQIDVRSFVRAIVQHTRVGQNLELAEETEERTADLFLQVLYSYKLNPQTAVYLGYAGSHLDVERGGWVETGNSLFVKVGYSWLP